MPRTKLVCTIGPASGDRIPELIAAGMDVARVNFSHAMRDERVRHARAVRDAAAEAGREVGLLVDLPGPKIRLGRLPGDELTLETGARFVLGGPADATPAAGRAAVSHPDLAADLEPGDHVLLADGAAELKVLRAGDELETEVVRGGTVRSYAGINVPAERLSLPALTERDRADVPMTLEIGADYVAQSFVRRASDVAGLRRLLGDGGPAIVAKIETRPAVDDFDAICGVVDAVMIARGDLGVELPYEEVPILQKQLVRRALDRGVPAIVATQMLESMTHAPRPTRAETSDVANAILDGADAVMLSAETAIGAYPILAAGAATRISRLVDERGGAFLAPGAPSRTDSEAAALATAATAIAADEAVVAIGCYTRTGATARLLASRRPNVPIVAFSPDPRVVRQLTLVRGVEPRRCERLLEEDEGGPLALMARLLADDGRLPRGAPVVLLASSATPGIGRNALELHRIGA